MITPQVADEVRRLLADGKLSNRKIAGLTGVSRGTVAAIADGKRSDYEALQRARRETELPEPTGPPQRCPGCGGLVYMPCRLCHLRKALAQSAGPPAPRQPMQIDEPLRLNLRGKHRERYEQVRAASRMKDE